jgi:single-stranded DNA-binding protein
MRDMNEVLMEVRLGNDGILRETKSGKKILNFGGANHATSDKDRAPFWGAYRIWEKLAEALAPHLTKGRKVLVKGHIPVLPAPSDKGKVIRNGAEAYFTGDSRTVVKAILKMVRDNHESAADDDKVINAIANQVSTQVVVDVDKLRFMDPPPESTEPEAGTAEADATDLTDDIPF